MPALATSFQHNIARFSKDNKEERVRIGTEIGKEEVMLPLFTGNMILCVEKR